MCFTEAIARILVFVANFAFVLVGVALLTVGILYKVHFTHYTDAIPDEFGAIEYIPILAIVVGSIIFVIAFLGCCGTLKSSTCMLTTYASILFVIFLLQVALGAFALIEIRDTDDLETQVDKTIKELFGQYDKDREVVDLIQQNLQCCGTYSPLSWGLNIPSSCLDNDTKIPFTQGCSSAMFQFIHGSVRIIGIVALVISVTEVAGAILALGLANCIRADTRKAGYYS